MSITPPKQPMTAEEAAEKFVSELLEKGVINNRDESLCHFILGIFLAGANFGREKGRIQGLREAADLIDPRTSYGHQAIERIKKIEEGKA